MNNGRRAWLGGASVCLLAGMASAEVVNVLASRDTSMYSEAGDLSNGIGVYMFTGRNRVEDDRRALIAFDLSGIPAGSTVTEVSLVMHVSLSQPFASPTPVAAHRVLAAWGEGASDAGTPGGTGILAEAGDATWTMRAFPGTAWTTPGGEFAPNASGSGVAGDPETFMTMASTAGLVADVQGWIDAPATNQGWILLGTTTPGSARRFDSRQSETPALAPRLTVTYTPPILSCPADLDDGSGTGTPDGGVDINDLLYFLVQFEAGSENADLDNGSGMGVPDGGVDVSDLLFYLIRFELGC